MATYAKRFELGQIVVTPGVMDLGIDVGPYLRRHAGGDWGALDAEDAAQNERALVRGERVISVYTTPAAVTFWVITEADRSVTTLMLPEEY